MREKSHLLAYCGLYCGDCAGYSGDIANAAGDLTKVLERYQFHRTAKHLFPDALKDYDKFQEMLGFMTDLKCAAVCRDREDGETTCEIRKCCRDRGFYACHECDGFETCDKLKRHDALHGDAWLRNLRAIKEMGVEAWVGGGERFWFGDEPVDTP